MSAFENPPQSISVVDELHRKSSKLRQIVALTWQRRTNANWLTPSQQHPEVSISAARSAWAASEGRRAHCLIAFDTHCPRRMAGSAMWLTAVGSTWLDLQIWCTTDNWWSGLVLSRSGDYINVKQAVVLAYLSYVSIHFYE